MLFKIYMRKLPLPPDRVSTVTYVDDITLITSNSKVDEVKGQIKPYLEELHGWLTNRKLQLSADKSSSTIFTIWS